MRIVTRIAYKFRGFSGDEVSERIVLGDKFIRIHISETYKTASVHIDEPPFTEVHEVRSTSSRGAKVAVRRWLVKAGASLAQEARKRI